MRRWARWTGNRGMSLPEATIILMVTGVLTSVVAPSVADYVNDARTVKVKEDCEAIGLTVARLVRDVGSCVKKNGAIPCTKGNRVDLLYSSGPKVAATDLGQGAAPFTSADLASALNWDRDAGANADAMESQFVTNAPGYDTPATNGNYSLVGPQMRLGWRGGYVSSPIGPDPWGKRYLVNTAFMTVAVDATDGMGEGNRNGGWSHDVFCISPGANGVFETPVAAPNGGTVRTGDDFVYVISGDTR